MHGSKGGFLKAGPQAIIPNFHQPLALLCAVVVLAIFGATPSLNAQSEPVTVGYRDFGYGSEPAAEITGEKPQSKLWWNDGFWWGSLWDPSQEQFTIHRFEVTIQSWINTGTPIDDRERSKADALWDGQRLYVASNIHTSDGGPTNPSNAGRLYRYSYDAGSKSYSLDAGFPVTVNGSTAQAIVLEKDSTGQLWITWVEEGKVKVNRTLGDDLTWGEPFDLPVQGSDVTSDDISSIVAFGSEALAGGNKIGIMWSNQYDRITYFAVHHDNDADEVWQPREQALADENLGAVSDDHINLKMSCDGNGNLYAVTKTSLTGSGDPQIYVLKRDANGVWTRHLFGKRDDHHTRPGLLVNHENQKLYVFARSTNTGQGVIYMKTADLSNLEFSEGLGIPFIESETDVNVNNPTTTKQCVNCATGILVAASDTGTRYYLHNYIDLEAGKPTITSFTPTAGLVGTEVTVTGSSFTSTTGVAFSGVAATGFTVVNDTQLRATVPPGATTGQIRVTNAYCLGLSADEFHVQYTLTTSTMGSGSVDLNPPGGIYEDGTVVTLTTNPASGWGFGYWIGDLSGSTNPAAITIDADKSITAIFTESAPTGQVVHEQTQTGGSSGSATVTTSANLTAVGGHLYLAAIATKPNVAVNAVSGLGLSWTLVKAQCSGRNTTGVEVWMAQGTPGSDGTVTAILSSAPANAVIAVSRYSGVDAANPIGNLVSGNTNGANGSCSGGKDNTSYLFSLATTRNGAVAYGAAAMRNKTHAPGAEYTERAEIKQSNDGDAASLAVEDKSLALASMVAVDGSFSSNVDWAVVAVEIKPQITVLFSFAPLHDAYVRLSSPAQSFPSTPALLQRLTTGEVINTYLKFNVTGLSGTVESAKLRLYVANASDDGGAIYTVSNNYEGTTTEWTESGLNWDNAPAIGGTALSVVGVASVGNWIELDVTTAISGDGIYSFGLKNASSDVVNYSSKEGANPPELVIATGTGLLPGPTITAFTPGAGYVGLEVTITGTYFGGTTEVAFNGASASTFTVDSPAQIRAEVPAGATTGKIRVTTSAGTVLSVADFAITSPPPTFTFTPLYDAYVRFSSPTQSFPSTSALLQRVTDSEKINTYLKFNVTGLSGPAESAKLRLYVTNASDDGGSVYVVSNNHEGGMTAWTENDLNWDNAPAIAGTALSVIGAVSVGSWIEVDVTSAIAGNGTYSFGLKNTSSDVVNYSSKEGGNAPELVIRTGSVSSSTLKSAGADPNPAPLGGEHEDIATSFLEPLTLYPNHPNPFNAQTTIEFTLPLVASVQLVIFNVAGQPVRRLIRGTQPAGRHRVIWDGKDERGHVLTSGIFYYRLQVDRESRVRQMTILK